MSRAAVGPAVTLELQDVNSDMPSADSAAVAPDTLELQGDVDSAMPSAAIAPATLLDVVATLQGVVVTLQQQDVDLVTQDVNSSKVLVHVVLDKDTKFKCKVSQGQNTGELCSSALSYLKSVAGYCGTVKPDDLVVVVKEREYRHDEAFHAGQGETQSADLEEGETNERTPILVYHKAEWRRQQVHPAPRTSNTKVKLCPCGTSEYSGVLCAGSS